jgi:hypothetical protein
LDIFRAGAAVAAIGLVAAPAVAHAATTPAGYTIVRSQPPTTTVADLIDGGRTNWVGLIVSTINQPVTDTFATICAA